MLITIFYARMPGWSTEKVLPLTINNQSFLVPSDMELYILTA